ncbi:hypothetical protein CPC16_005051 [Podila verticillata]|nr:hypothetical protein BGZ52_002466 [Haplosporangium bisporale]KAF9214753.1 hypothetical protein BGZ59_003051 [Podila verticillata]KAF9368797.1 hypothetical protein CPC16_005051 [Podila verticillata]KAI9234874.1 MAG: DOPA-like domain-containing protein [Podila humilis]KFH66930.1 hypothetical protein MVEG_07455 [Podila verticillata NRRL 6337]
MYTPETPTSLSAAKLLDAAQSQEMKEFHFHTYFFQTNTESLEAAREFRAKIEALVQEGYFHVVPQVWGGGINTIPLGPHVVGSFETWVPIEHFSRAFGWFAQNRGQFSILVHPLTKDEIIDHTDRAVWLGQPVPMDFKVLRERLDKIPLQFPELGMGYSAKEQ